MREHDDKHRMRRRFWALVLVTLSAVAMMVSAWTLRRDWNRQRRKHRRAVRIHHHKRLPSPQWPKRPQLKLLSGSWGELHEQGVKALGALRFEEAELALRSALAAAESQDQSEQKRSRLIASTAALGEVYRLLGLPTDARRFFRKARLNSKDEAYRERLECDIFLGEFGDQEYGWASQQVDRCVKKVFGAYSVEYGRLASLMARANTYHFVVNAYGLSDRFCPTVDVLARQTLGDLDRGFIVQNLGVMHLRRNEYARAHRRLREAVECWGRVLPDRHPDLAAARMFLGTCYVRMGKFDKAEPLLDKARRAFEALPGRTHPYLADVYQAIAEIREAHNDLDEAARLYRRAMEIYIATLGYNVKEDGSHEACVNRRNPLSARYTRAEWRLGQVLCRQGNHVAGVEILYEAGWHVKGTNQDWAWNNYHSLAGIERTGPCGAEPAPMWSDVTSRFWPKNARDRRREVLRSLARACVEAGQFQRALDLLDRIAKDVFSDHTDPIDLHVLRAAALRGLGKEDQARQSEQMARSYEDRFYGAGGRTPGRTLLLEARRDVLSQRYEQALAKLIERDRLRRPMLRRLLPLCADDRVAALAVREAWASHFMIAVALRCKDPSAAARSVFETDMASKAMTMDAQADQAETVHASADPKLHELAGQITHLRKRIATEKLATPPIARANSVPRVEPPPQSPSSASGPKTKWVQKTDFLYDAELGMCSARTKEFDPVSGTWVARNEACYDCMANSQDLPQASEMEVRLASLEAQLAERCEPIMRLRLMRSCSLEDFQSALPEGTAFISYWKLWDLVTGGGLCTPRRYVAMVIRKQRPPVLLSVVACRGETRGTEEIEEQLREFKTLVASAPEYVARMGEHEADRWVRHYSREVSKQLVYPLWEFVKDCPRWIVSSDAELATLPMGLLTEPGTDRYLIESHEITYVPSGRCVVDFGRQTEGGGPSLVLADPDFERTPSSMATGVRGADFQTRHLKDLRWNRLASTRAEGKRVAERLEAAGLPAVLKCGAEATKAALLNAKAPRILHVATHGFFQDDPALSYDAEPFVRRKLYVQGKWPGPPNPLLHSGLAMAGANRPDGIHVGIVTAYEMKWMNLWGTELVVLSACETGLGQRTTGSGVRGMRQCLLQAGARRIVTGLWQVPDRQTSDLMDAFYRRVAEGERTGSALRQAALEIRDKRLETQGVAHPFFWGGFVLVGDPGRVNLR